MKNLPLLRYYLEVISVPVFAWLVVHLGGHGLMLIKEKEHDHESHNDHGHEAPFNVEALFEILLSVETLGGILTLIFFVWLWHLPILKKLVPCSHDHCHHKTVWPHVAATAAFAFHWFPEAQVRYELLHNFSASSWFDLAALIGFLSHFLVDGIILILLVSFWKQLWQKISLAASLLFLWGGSFVIGEQGGLHFEGITEPIVLLLSAFLLTMFVHKPHRPLPICKGCKKL